MKKKKLLTDGRTNRPTFLEMQFYISVMFLGLPDDIREEKLHFCNLKERITEQWTDQRTDRPSYRDARTHLKIKTKQNIKQGTNITLVKTKLASVIDLKRKFKKS